MKIQNQLESLKKLKLPYDEFVVVSSGALAIRGIRDAKDIDVIVTESLWDMLSKKYCIELNDWGIECLALPDDIEIFNPKQSIFGNSKVVSFEDILKEADVFDGIKFMNLEHLKKAKLELGRPRDLEDVKLIDDYLATQ